MIRATLRIAAPCLLLLALICSVVALGTTSKVAANSGNLAANLDSSLTNARLGAKAQISACVIDLSAGRIVMGRNKDTALIPASNQKILTSAAAIHQLGSGHTLATTLHMSGSKRGHILDGDLLLVGCGDPNISGRMHRGDVTRPLRELAHGLASAGITHVNGSLYFDGRAFTGPRMHAEWPEDQFLKWYSAEISALTLNDNCLTITVEPGSPGRQASIALSPQTGYVSTTGSVATKGNKSDPKVGFGRMKDSNEIRLWGELSAYRGAYTGEITVADPDAYCAHVLLETLAANGIRVAGGTRPADGESDRRNWREIGRYESDLGTIAAVCNQRSQNLYAEALFRIFARTQGQPGSFAGGSAAIEQWLKARKIPAPGLVVTDGSGLARSNRVSAETLARVLAFMDKGKEASVFRSTFAVSGESGTLERRLGGEKTRGRVFAKTGTIRGVTSLSGYVLSQSGRRYAFSVIVNNSSGSARGAIDKFVTELVTGG